MAGALTLMLGEGSAGGGPGGTLVALAWNNVYGAPGTRFAANNTLTISGISGAVALKGSLSGHGVIGYVLNGAAPVWAPAWGDPISAVVHAGDTLAWAVFNEEFGGVDVSGTASIVRTDTGASLDTFTYFVQF